MKVCIDFQGGAHGNYLEFVCNMLAGVQTSSSPFNTLGASHNKKYYSKQVFYADHYSFGKNILDSNLVVAIKINEDDLLPLNQISLLRAGDYGYDNNDLEIDTFNKLNNPDYRWVLDTILSSFFIGQVQTSYNAVKDPSWPNISTLSDFNNLPDEIKKECIEVHNLELLELNESNPDCPRHVLREFFQIGFSDPSSHGFIKQQLKMVYPPGTDLYEFQFGSFYNVDSFVNELKQIAKWASITYNEWDKIIDLHNDFLTRQIYKDSKTKCDAIVRQIINGGAIPKVNLIEESYINAMLIRQGHECRY